MMRSASGTGSGRKRTPFTRLKMAVFAPIPRASARMATQVKVLFLRSIRKPYRTSWKNVFMERLSVAEGDHRIGASGAQGGNITGEQRDNAKRKSDARESRQIERTDIVEH